MTAGAKLRTVVDGPQPLVIDVTPRMTAERGRGTVVTRLPARIPGTGEPSRFEAVVAGWRFEVAVEPAARAELRERAARIGGARATSVRRVIHAQIPGRVVSVAVAVGDAVERGQRLLSIEAMKMENAVLAPRAGTIERVGVAAGEDVELGDELAVMA
jgi:biotin carboxyl carrier protein